MAILLKPDRWKRNPTQPLAVDWDHPLSQGLLELGYIAAGRPYSAIQREQPSPVGLAEPMPTAHGGALRFTSNSTYINLARNVAAGSLVASVLVRTTKISTAETMFFTSAMALDGTKYKGHWLKSFTTQLEFGFGANTGNYSAHLRVGRSPTGTLIVGESVSLGGVCRGNTNFSLYKNGKALSVTTAGSGGAYVGGVHNGTVNYMAPYTVGGAQDSASWAFWGTELTADAFLELEDNPFAMLVKPRRRVWVEVAAGGGPTLVSASDTLTPSLTESLAVLVVAGLADTLTPSVSDAAALLASLGLADTLTPSLTEAAALAAAVALVDTLTPGLAEVAAVLAAVAVAEALTPALAESASIAGSVTPVSLSDTLTPSVTEAAGLVALLGLTDALTPAVTEALQAAGAVALVDALTPSLGAALSTLTAVAVADVATPSLTDAAAVLVAQALADTLTPALAESAGVADIKALTDTLTPALTEALTVVASAIAASLPVMRIQIPDDARLIHVPDDARLILIPEGLK